MSEPASKNNLFPVFLKLETLRLLIVGAGNVATEKLTAVLNHSPNTLIKIISKEINESVSQLIRGKSNITLIKKEFEPNDLNDIDLVISAIGHREISNHIKEEAHKRNLLVNVADTPDLCDFYLGSILQKGNLKIAISTNGQSPTAAKRIKEMLQHALPEEIDEMIDNLHTIRNQLRGDFQNKVNKMNEITRSLIE
jgi:siroheme synthase-like protein